MDLSFLSQNERAMLQLLCREASIKTADLIARCKQRFGWSASTVRRTLRSLINRKAVTVTGGRVCTQISAEQLDTAQWNSLVEGAFGQPEPALPTHRRSPFRKPWLWIALAAVCISAVIAVALLREKPLPEELSPCIAALEQWQSSESCQIRNTYQRLGDHYGAYASEYWRSGSDYIKCTYFTDYTHATMYRDGSVYINADSENGLVWVPHTVTPNPNSGVWPLSFVWSSSEYIMKGVEETDSGRNISFVVIEQDPQQPYYEHSPYHVCFRFGKDGQLQSIALTLVDTDASVSVCNYQLVSTDTAEISKYIQAQVVDPAADDE